MTRHHLQLTVLLGALTAFAPMSIDMYLPSLPTLERAFSADAASVQLTLAAFFVGLALGQALYGPLVDRFGRRTPLYAGTTLYVLASAGCALAPGVHSLIVLRFAEALGGCAGVVVARAVVRDLFDEQESARMFSLMMLVMGVAPILAPLAGGYLLVRSGWRSIFWALAVFGALCLAGALLWLPETRPRRETPRHGIGGAVRAYGQLLADRRFLGCTLAGGFAQAGMFAYISGSPVVFIDLYGVPAEHYGWLFGLNALGLIAASQLNRRLLVTHSAARILARANYANATCGIVLVLLASTGTGGFAGILVPLFGYVASLGFVFPNSTALAMGPQGERAGSASALLGTVQFGAATLASMAVGFFHDGSARPMSAVIAVCGVLAVLAQRLLAR
ncbi:MAG TPA: Bcr/CflA family multidrug efflux MFS transporter [Burkholderiales bacterium]|nr:Bcr/CflA family multidrug efflux MFS transporter [Burkholderiales bacterium]